MSVVGSQQQTFLRLLRALQPHWRRDAALPARIQALFAQHKEFGSRDRRLYRELIYTSLRYLPWIEPLLDHDPVRAVKIAAWLAASTRDTVAFRTATAGDWPDAASLADRGAFLALDPRALLPEWFRDERPAAFESPEIDTLLERARLWLRVQTSDDSALREEFAKHGWELRRADVLPHARQVLAEADVTKSEAFARGDFEVQDLGSQLLLEAVGVTPGERWFDACAGAGGKTLQLARLLGPEGHVDAFDVRASALAELRARVARARLRTVRTVDRPDANGYQGVLIDAPCSGTGTWRRAPHLKWTTTAASVADRSRLQRTLLHQHAALVRPGGHLVYATCSLARSENEAVVTAFLAQHPEFTPGEFRETFEFPVSDGGITLAPARYDTDGFFVASLRRR